jgi:hypothetical protein
MSYGFTHRGASYIASYVDGYTAGPKRHPVDVYEINKEVDNVLGDVEYHTIGRAVIDRKFQPKHGERFIEAIRSAAFPDN